MLFTKFSSRSIRICQYAITCRSLGYSRVNFQQPQNQNAENVLKTEEITQNGQSLDKEIAPVVEYPPNTPDHFTNVYIKNFANKLDDEKLRALFEKYGTILSCVVIKDEQNKSRGFGFVSFENTEEAKRAVKEMNGYKMPGSHSKLTVCRALPKEERKAELAKLYEQFQNDKMQRYRDLNLYVAKIDESIDSNELRRNFEKYGTITGAKIMPDLNKFSQRYGFVCFEKPEDAIKAAVGMNNHILNGKRLHVAFSQRKEDREANIDFQYMELMAVLHMKFAPEEKLSSVLSQEQENLIGERLRSLISNIAEPDKINKIMEVLIGDSELSNLMENKDLLQTRVNEISATLQTSS